MVLRSRRKKKDAEQEEREEVVATTLPMTVEELEAELPGGAVEDDEDLLPSELPQDATPLDRAAMAAVTNSELAARVLRTWLAGAKKSNDPAANDDEYEEAA